MLSILLVLFLEGAFATWTFGQFVAGYAGAWLNAVLTIGFLALLTGIASLFGSGRKRLVGVAMSLATIAVVVFFLVQTS